MRQRQCQNQRGHDHDRAQIPRHGITHVQAQHAASPSDLESEFLFEIEASARDQVVAGIGLAFVGRLSVVVKFGACVLGTLHGALRDFDFGVRRTTREILDRMAVVIARGKIHVGEIAAAAQHFVHQADALEELFPIERRREPHTGDDVAHRHAHGGLLLMLGAHDFIRCGALRGEAFIEPDKNGADLGIEVAQALDQLHGEGALERLVFEPAQHGGGRYGGLPRRPEHAIGEDVGFHARVAAAHDAFGNAPQVFHQHDAQRDCHGPEFADGQRLHALVGADESAQYFRIEAAVVMRHKRPGDAKDARKAFQVARREFRQFAVKTCGKIVANFA